MKDTLEITVQFHKSTGKWYTKEQVTIPRIPFHDLLDGIKAKRIKLGFPDMIAIIVDYPDDDILEFGLHLFQPHEHI